ncbi:hypothetical protein ID0093_14530 [Helicobacter pylori]
MAYIANLQFLPLDEILLSNGYKHKVEKSSKNNPALYNEYDTIKGTLIVSRKPDGSYHYFNTHNDEDKGTIIAFCKNRGLDFNDLIKNRDDLEISDKPNYKYNNSKLYAIITKEQEAERQKVVKQFEKLPIYNTESSDLFHTLLDSRSLDKSLLKPYNHLLKEDEHANLCVPCYLVNDDGNLIQGGYNKRLSKPFTMQGATNPTKHLMQAGSIKGFEVLSPQNTKNIQNIIVAESVFDGLSVLEMQGFDPNQTAIISTIGNFTEERMQKFVDKFLNTINTYKCKEYNEYHKEIDRYNKQLEHYENYTNFQKRYEKWRAKELAKHQNNPEKVPNDPIFSPIRDKNNLIPKPIFKPSALALRLKEPKIPNLSLNVILAMDNDEQGRKFNTILEKIFYAHTKEIPNIYTPISKDANDDLKIAKALGLKQISNRILQDFLFDAKEKIQNPTTTPSQKSILANQLQKLQDLMPKPKLLQGVFKRMEFLLDVRCVQILNDLKTRHNKSYTKIVENLILNSQISFYKQQKITSALGSLAMLYSSLNATCFNFNQIAYHLNNAALLGENVIHLGLLQDIETQLKAWSEKTKILNLAIKKSAFIVAHCLKGDKKILKGMNL